MRPQCVHEGPFEFRKEFGEVFPLIVSVKPAGIGQYPNSASGDLLWLHSNGDLLILRGDPESGDTNKRHNGGPISHQFPLQERETVDLFVGGKFIGTSGGPSDEIGDTQSKLRQGSIFRRVIKSRREATIGESGPKPISGPGKVVAYSSGVQAGIDPNKQYLQIWANHIW